MMNQSAQVGTTSFTGSNLRDGHERPEKVPFEPKNLPIKRLPIVKRHLLKEHMTQANDEDQRQDVMLNREDVQHQVVQH